MSSSTLLLSLLAVGLAALDIAFRGEEDSVGGESDSVLFPYVSFALLTGSGELSAEYEKLPESSRPAAFPAACLPVILAGFFGMKEFFEGCEDAMWCAELMLSSDNSCRDMSLSNDES